MVDSVLHFHGIFAGTIWFVRNFWKRPHTTRSVSPHGQGETAAPILEGEGDGGYGEHVPHDGGEQFEKSKHTCLERTSGEKKWTDRKTFYIRLNSRRNDQNNEVKDNSVKKDLNWNLTFVYFVVTVKCDKNRGGNKSSQHSHHCFDGNSCDQKSQNKIMNLRST